MLAKLILEDGSVFHGEAFGSPTSAAGEVIFNTGMVGYPESFTDPSYEGQILILTYPLIGNYGVPDPENNLDILKTDFESERVHIAGLVVSEYSRDFSHWSSHSNLDAWLKANHIPAITGLDTRLLTQKLRERGSMLGKIVVLEKDLPFYDPNLENLVARVASKKPVEYGVESLAEKSRSASKSSFDSTQDEVTAPHGESFGDAQDKLRRTMRQSTSRLFGQASGKKRVLLIDCGCKYNIVRSLLRRNVSVRTVPWDWDISKEQYDGIVISNGPGDPKTVATTVRTVREAYQQDKPMFGICLGSQIMALAAGADTYKLKYGHHSQNQPCVLVGSKRCFITSQNHGYAVDERSLPPDWEPWFFNANDGSNEGIRHRTKPFSAVQFHPEASPGPLDTGFLFDEFVEKL
jgi:carbamoyl-phosphate synthase small subunit